MKQLDKNVIWIFWLNSFIGFTISLNVGLFILSFIIMVISSYFSSNEHSYSLIQTILQDWVLFIPLIILLSLVLSYVWAYYAYHFYKYELTPDGFRKELGIVYKKYVTIPYDRIQNVDIYRGIMARILGISDIQIQTAGMSGVALSEGRLPGLSRRDAEALRDELIHRVSKSKDQGL